MPGGPGSGCLWTDRFLGGSRQKSPHPGTVPKNKPGLGEGGMPEQGSWESCVGLPAGAEREPTLKAQAGLHVQHGHAVRSDRTGPLQDPRRPAPGGPSKLEGWAL